MKKISLIVTVLLVLTSVFAPIYQNRLSIGQTTQPLPASYVSDASSLLENFTIVVLPDTQGYSQNYPSIFNNQTQWIADNVESLNIVFVSQLGDLVNVPYDTYQWINANQSMSKLDGKVPWAVLPGNHDMDDGNITNFNTYFGSERFSNETWYAGAYGAGDNSNSYQLFSASGTDYLILNLQYDPSDDVLLWASHIIDSYPHRKVIVSTHDYLMGFLGLGQRSEIGERIWHGLIKQHAEQVFLVLCGHAGAEDLIADSINGNIVYQMLADYQNSTYIESGWLRILTFAQSQGKVFVKTYSPIIDKYKSDSQSEFTLDYNKAITPAAVPKNPARYNTTYIRADGSIEPPTNLIHRDGDTYVLLDNIFGSLVVERDNVVIDGGGFTIRGHGADYRGEREYAGSIEEGNMTIPWYTYKDVNTSYVGIYSCAEGLTVMNLKITEFWCGIELERASDNHIVSNDLINNNQGIWNRYSSNNTITNNTISNNAQGLTLETSYNTVENNTITNNTEYGIKLSWAFNTVSKNTLSNNSQGVWVQSSHNSFQNNAFLNNSEQVHLGLNSIFNSWDNGEIGNYWSDYNGKGHYYIDENNIDHYPLTQAPNKLNVGFILPIAVTILAVSIVTSLLLYRRHEKTVNLKK
ncbi:MAG: NosD domain-containing protein [Candidatus Bathyarchaeia archaeon]|jgi:parallel beta-helix repeat protein